MIDLRSLRHALAVAEHGGFGRAARALGLSQPALSRSVQALEARIGTRIFDRAHGGVAPTDVGRVVLDRARSLLRAADEVERDLGQMRGLEVGEIAVAAGPYSAELVLAPALATMAREHPNVGVRLTLDSWEGAVRRLRDRQVDFAVAETSQLSDDPDLAVEPLREHRGGWLVRRRHPLTRKRRVTAADVLAYPLVSTTRIPPRVLEPLLARSGTPARAVPSRAVPTIACEAISIVKQVVRGSDAVGMMVPAMVTGEVERGELELLVAGEPWLRTRAGIITLRDRTLSPAAAALRRYVLDADATLPSEP